VFEAASSWRAEEEGSDKTMKTRLQISGVDYGSKDQVYWSGDMPMLSGVPGMRISLIGDNDEVDAFFIKQICFEVCKKDPSHCEQVIYVKPVDPSKVRLLIEDDGAGPAA